MDILRSGDLVPPHGGAMGCGRRIQSIDGAKHLATGCRRTVLRFITSPMSFWFARVWKVRRFVSLVRRTPAMGIGRAASSDWRRWRKLRWLHQRQRRQRAMAARKPGCAGGGQGLGQRSRLRTPVRWPTRSNADGDQHARRGCVRAQASWDIFAARCLPRLAMTTQGRTSLS
jgi:hypothetical protein